MESNPGGSSEDTFALREFETFAEARSQPDIRRDASLPNGGVLKMAAFLLSHAQRYNAQSLQEERGGQADERILEPPRAEARVQGA